MSIEQLIAANTEALKELAEAIRSGAGKTSSSTGSTGSATGSSKKSDDDKGPFHWSNPTTGEFGTAKTKAAFDKLAKADEDVVRITAEELKALEAAEAGDGGGDDADVPSVDDLKREFGAFLQIDDEKKRNNRKGFVQKMVDSVGAVRASEIPEKYRAAALKMLKDALAGEKVDPSSLKDSVDDSDDGEEGLV